MNKRSDAADLGIQHGLFRRLLLGGFLAGGLLAAGLAMWQSVSSAGGEVLPPAQRWVVAAPLVALWLFFSVQAWVAVFEAPAQRNVLTGALVLSQLGKYVPGGGIVQVTGMVAMSRNDQISTSRLALGLPVIWLCAVAAGGVALAGLVALYATLPLWFRLLGGLGAFAPVLLWRPIMIASLTILRRITPRVPPPDDLPSQRAILVSGAWVAASLAVSGAAYALLAQPQAEGGDLVSLTLAFMVAWTVGFLVFPVPGGLGVREAVLVWIVGASVASLVGASLAHRIIGIGVELAAVGLYLLVRFARSHDDLSGEPDA